MNLGSINLSGLGAGAQGATSAGNLNLAALGIDANAFIDQALESLAATAAMLAPALEAQARGAGGTGDLGLATSQLGNRWTQEEWKSKVRSVEAVMSRVKEARDLRKKQQDQQSKGKGPATPSRVSAPSAPSTPVGSTSSITTPASAAKALQSLLLDPKGTELATLSKEDLNLLSPLILSALKSKDGTATIPLTFDIDLGPSGQGAGDVKQLLSSVESIVGDFMQGVGHILKGAGMELVEDKDKRDIRIVSAANSGPASVTSKAQAAQPRNVEADLAVLQRQLSDGMAGVEKSLQEFNGLLAGFGGEAGIIGGSKVGTSTPASMSRATDSLALNSADVERHGLGKRAAPGAQNKVIADLELQLNEARAETMALELQLRKLADSNSKIVSLVFQAPNEPKPEILLSGLAGTAPSGGK